jgi:hypothetical protein
MMMQLGPVDCLLMLAMGFLGGIGHAAAPNLICRLRSTPLPLDRELAESLAERAAQAFFFRGPMADIPWNEFERYEAVQDCERQIRHTLIAYVDTLRRRQGDDPDQSTG